MAGKKKVPPLAKKQRTWADTDPDSLTAALHHDEITRNTEASEKKPPAKKKRATRKKKPA